MTDPLPLFLHWTAFLKWTLKKTAKFPRSVRFTLASRIDNIALDVLEAVISAQYSKQKVVHLRRASLGIDKLRVLLRIAHELGHLDHRGYEFAARKLDEGGRMAGGWLKSRGAGE